MMMSIFFIGKGVIYNIFTLLVLGMAKGIDGHLHVAVILVDVFLYRGLVFFRCRIKGKFFLGKLHDIFCGMCALPDTYRVVGFLHRQDDLQIPGGE